MNTVPQALTEADFDNAINRLTSADRDFAALVKHHGRPPFWTRPSGFATLVQIIVEQQVSLASARAVFARLRRALGSLTARRLLQADPAVLAGAGLTRQKQAYCLALAEAVAAGRLRLADLARLDDERARATLTDVKGIGPWTADVYLLVALRRPDLWPVGDLALIRAIQAVKGLPERPDAARLTALAEPWRPLRSVAVRLLWHQYLSSRGRGWEDCGRAS